MRKTRYIVLFFVALVIILLIGYRYAQKKSSCIIEYSADDIVKDYVIKNNYVLDYKKYNEENNNYAKIIPINCSFDSLEFIVIFKSYDEITYYHNKRYSVFKRK